MAMTLEPRTNCTFSFVDQEGTVARTQIHFDDIDTMLIWGLTDDGIEEDVMGALGPWVPGGLSLALSNLTDCPMSNVNISIGYFENDPALTAGADESEKNAVFQFRNALNDFDEIIIPGCLDSILQGNMRYIDPANAAVAAFVAAVLDQSGDADIRDTHGNAYVGLNEAWKRHEKSQVRPYRRTG